MTAWHVARHPAQYVPRLCPYTEYFGWRVLGVAETGTAPPRRAGHGTRSSMSESGSTPTTSPTTRAHPHPVKISFELFPPRTDAAALALGRTIDRLSDTDPDFISVTFGAGGTSRERSLTVLRYILEHTRIDPMAHLTCVGSSRAEATELVQQFLDAGIRSFLALRGDPPAEHPNGFSLGDLASAAELVHLIRTTHGGELDRLAVAAFPTGHAKS